MKSKHPPYHQIVMNYYVYIMASPTGVLYVGSTSNLEQRVNQHKNGHFDGFTKKYGVKKLVYCESVADAKTMVQRERQLKGWRRSKKLQLIETINPQWKDLAEE